MKLKVYQKSKLDFITMQLSIFKIQKYFHKLLFKILLHCVVDLAIEQVVD